ncbi:MAG: long-chain fatty acid--CoA ligase [Betaproteobacteria bacterium]|nr:long-chain fatty acid--CoA ligase [Betaproteobacteria bacterium]NBQ79021.1 long-chain fatty acid--CoA ligase [Betaproteobacteria bacterium]NBT82679.1 long-chain fatty acid--CoA ligase [Betaproteobacteria bacterium]NCY08493.1 long-chain fatty acid--CoA ligase [Betaproteobacteria bacterium]NDC86165.1 long-chain fatty acid--CoA ligase [Betaproteobacteria bacterium]
MSSLSQYLWQKAKALPHNIALVDKTISQRFRRGATGLRAEGYSGETCTFGQFHQRVSQLAHGIALTIGLKQGDRIGLFLENRAEFLDLLFACWHLGACAVPINAKLHPKEVAHIASDCGIKALFTSEKQIEALRGAITQIELSLELVDVDSGSYGSLYDHPAMSLRQVMPHDLAWIFYTSGTTGKPKGAMLTHRSLLFMSMAYCSDVEIVQPGDHKVHAAPLSHASGLYALPHLLGGGTQVILNGFDTEGVLSALDQFQNVTMFAAPTMVTRLMHSVERRGEFPGLRTLYYGGGPMYVNDLQMALDCFGPRLYQLYGQGESPMTITGLSKSMHRGAGDHDHLRKLASCGYPRTGVEVRVVNDLGVDQAAGELGEVICKSDCTMLGYWNNSAATAQALRDGWLWTGDVGILDEDGLLSLRDRSKDMIISGGTNIYPREIEEVLLKHPDLLEVSVVGKPHSDWGEEVVAFYVAKEGSDVSANDLNDLCLANIARFKRPKQYVRTDTLPKNNYGKILKTVLREQLLQEQPHV